MWQTFKEERNEMLLEVKNLSIVFAADKRKEKVEATKDISFSIKEREVVAIVGESGCGKSILCRSLVGILPTTAEVISGEILYKGKELRTCSKKQLQNIRGGEIAMVWQDPVSFFQPSISVGKQVIEGLKYHRKMRRKEREELGVSLMEKVGIENAYARFHNYPYEFSGGMLQRCAIASAISCEPSLLIADEPTTALDSATQWEILELLKRLKEEKHMAILLVTHDLSVAEHMADTIVVMNHGRIVEAGTKEAIFSQPMHQKTKELLEAMPENWRD